MKLSPVVVVSSISLAAFLGAAFAYHMQSPKAALASPKASPSPTVKAVVTNVSIPLNILGGAVIVIPNKGTLVIDGLRYQKAENEIGKENLRALTMEFIKGTSADTLSKRFSGPATAGIISSYKNLSTQS